MVWGPGPGTLWWPAGWQHSRLPPESGDHPPPGTRKAAGVSGSLGTLLADLLGERRWGQERAGGRVDTSQVVTGLYLELYRPGWAVGLGEVEVLLGWFPLPFLELPAFLPCPIDEASQGLNPTLVRPGTRCSIS